MYRTEERPRKEPTSYAVDTPTRTDIIVRNGETTRIAFPCYYAYRKDGMPFPFHKVSPAVIDHYGWPRPDRRDHSFQPDHVPGLVIEPIHLSDEGYTGAEISFGTDAPSGLEADLEIDDFIVRLNLSVICSEATSEEIEVPYAIYIDGFFDHDGKRQYTRDIVTRGVVKVLPAVWQLPQE